MSLRRPVIDFYDSLCEEIGFFTPEESGALERFFPDKIESPAGLTPNCLRMGPLTLFVEQVNKLRCPGIDTGFENHYRGAFKRIAKLFVDNPTLVVWGVSAIETPCGRVVFEANCNKSGPLAEVGCDDPNCPNAAHKSTEDVAHT